MGSNGIFRLPDIWYTIQLTEGVGRARYDVRTPQPAREQADWV